MWQILKFENIWKTVLLLYHLLFIGDIWGPLIIGIGIAMLMEPISFSNESALVLIYQWIGSIIITLNCKLLGCNLFRLFWVLMLARISRCCLTLAIHLSPYCFTVVFIGWFHILSSTSLFAYPFLYGVFEVYMYPDSFCSNFCLPF